MQIVFQPSYESNVILQQCSVKLFVISIIMPLIICGKEGEEASCWFEQQLAPAGSFRPPLVSTFHPLEGSPPSCCLYLTLPPVDPRLTLLLLYVTFKLLLICSCSFSKVKIRGFHPLEGSPPPCCLYLPPVDPVSPCCFCTLPLNSCSFSLALSQR